jgi:hypothetical protein
MQRLVPAPRHSIAKPSKFDDLPVPPKAGPKGVKPAGAAPVPSKAQPTPGSMVQQLPPVAINVEETYQSLQAAAAGIVDQAPLASVVQSTIGAMAIAVGHALTRSTLTSGAKPSAAPGIDSAQPDVITIEDVPNPKRVSNSLSEHRWKQSNSKRSNAKLLHTTR